MKQASQGSASGALQLVVMARWPAPGRCKSRLAKGLGIGRAAAIQGRLTTHTFAVARRTRSRVGCRLVLAAQGLGPRQRQRWAGCLGCDGSTDQGAGSLGVRLQRQVLRAVAEGAERVVLIGSDLPSLEAADLEAAFELLGQAKPEAPSLVLGPAGDGGYWLIGLTHARAELLSGIPWGSGEVLGHTLAAAAALGIEPRLLPLRHDLDRAIDLRPWR